MGSWTLEMCICSLQFTCSTDDLKLCLSQEFNINRSSVNACHVRSSAFNYSLSSQKHLCHSSLPTCNFPEVNLAL